MRIENHPILGKMRKRKKVKIRVNGTPLEVFDGEPIAAALWANGINVIRYTRRLHQSRGIFCMVGLCTDCVATIDGIPNIRTCVTPVTSGMNIKIKM